jgi:hypothetical protein
MSKLTKNQKSVAEKVEAGKVYTLKEAAALVKDITTTKFDASVDVDVRLGVDRVRPTRWYVALCHCPMVLVRLHVCLLSVLPIRKRLPRQLVLIMLVSMNISKRLGRMD